MNNRNLTLLTDLYQLTMMQGYFERGENETVIFDMFFRSNPSKNGYSVVAGLEQVIDYIKCLHFTYDDITYLRRLKIFSDEFLHYLSGFHFSGDIYAIPEGSVVFPKEPLIKVIAPIMEAQLIETAILNIINHQSLIATKASRVVYAADGDGIMEFGLRRAQGPDAGLYGARAAMIGGCIGTSNVLAGELFQVPVKGTHAHSWIMSFPDEYTAFKTYANLYPNSCTLLVDTYDTLKSGVPNAIRVFTEMRENGIELKSYGIRLDSGDLAYLSKKARKMLDEAGFEDAVVTAVTRTSVSFRLPQLGTTAVESLEIILNGYEAGKIAWDVSLTAPECMDLPHLDVPTYPPYGRLYFYYDPDYGFGDDVDGDCNPIDSSTVLKVGDQYPFAIKFYPVDGYDYSELEKEDITLVTPYGTCTATRFRPGFSENSWQR